MAVTQTGSSRLKIPILFGPRRMYQGWYVAWVVFLSSGLPIGTAQYAFGVFVEPLEQQFGWTRGQVTAALSFGVISGLISPFVGRLVDRFGARPVMVVSLALVAAGFLFRPLITELWHFYLFSVLVYLGFPGATSVVLGRLVGLWFPRTRGRMMGTVTAGNNFGGLTMGPLAALLIAISSWQMAYVAFGLILALVAGLAALLVKDRAEDVAAEADRTGQASGFSDASKAAARSGFTLAQVLRLPAFWLITAGLTCAAFTYQGILTQLVPHLENEGLMRGHAVLALSIVAAMGIGSKLFFGALTDRIGARKATMISIGLQAGGAALLILPFGAAFLWLGVFVYGLGFGGLGALLVLSITEQFGLKRFGSIMGFVSLIQTIPTAVGPLMAGLLFDATKSYRPSIGIICAIFVAGILCLSVARLPGLPQDD